jgi:hypothetical protein
MPSSPKTKLPPHMYDFGIKSDDEIAAERKFVKSRSGKNYFKAASGLYLAERKGNTRKAAKFRKRLSKYQIDKALLRHM